MTLKTIFISIFLAISFGALSWYFQEHLSETKKNAESLSPKNTTQGTTAPSLLNLTPPGGGTGLKQEDLKLGTGKEAIPGSLISVHYTGWLTDGTQFDSSIGRGQPLEFKLGSGQVIQGWEQGVVGMKAGGKRKLTIPPELGYGDNAMGNTIPAHSTLVFEIELLNVQ